MAGVEDIQRQLGTKLLTQGEVLAYFSDAIRTQEANPEASELIAHTVFDHTHPSLLSFELSDEVLQLRDEFGALEAPGFPEDDSDPDAYRDQLWKRVKNLVNKNRTI